MLKTPAHPLRAQFEQRNLLDTWEFRKYCNEIGIKISSEDLKSLKERQILLPAVTIKGEVKSIKRIDSVDKNQNKFDMELGIFRNNAPASDNWLDSYQEQGAIVTNIGEYKTQPDDRYTDFYDRYQFFTLKRIRPFLTVTLRKELPPNPLFLSENALIAAVQKEVLRSNQIIAVINKIENLWIQRNKSLIELKMDLNLSESEGLNEARAIVDSCELHNFNQWKKSAEEIGCTWKINNLDTIKYVIDELLECGSFGLIPSKRAYVKKISNTALIGSEEPY